MEKLRLFCDLNEGQVALIDSLLVKDAKLNKRLLELGFVKGTKILLVKKTKEVFIVGLRGYTMALDKKIAELIKCWVVK